MTSFLNIYPTFSYFNTLDSARISSMNQKVTEQVSEPAVGLSIQGKGYLVGKINVGFLPLRNCVPDCSINRSWVMSCP